MIRSGFPRRALGVALLSIAAVTVGCTAVQTTQSGAVGVDRKQYMSGLVSEAALQQEANAQYSQLIAQARQQGVLDVNSAQVSRVRTITQKLIQQVGVFRPDAANWNWEVHVLNVDEANAWCMPGGKIAVYAGLIERLKLSDDELAAVIGHEIAHALREHAREQVSRQMATEMGLTVLSAVTGSQATSQLGSKLSEVMFTLPHSRSNETEADQIGVELAARAGYDPRAAITLWQKMESLGGGAPPEFLSTHPSAQSRMADLKVAADKVMPLYQKQ